LSFASVRFVRSEEGEKRPWPFYTCSWDTCFNYRIRHVENHVDLVPRWTFAQQCVHNSNHPTQPGPRPPLWLFLVVYCARYLNKDVVHKCGCILYWGRYHEYSTWTCATSMSYQVTSTIITSFCTGFGVGKWFLKPVSSPVLYHSFDDGKKTPHVEYIPTCTPQLKRTHCFRFFLLTFCDARGLLLAS